MYQTNMYMLSSMYNYLRLPHVKVNRASGGLLGYTARQRLIAHDLSTSRSVRVYILGERLDFCEFHRIDSSIGCNLFLVHAWQKK